MVNGMELGADKVMSLASTRLLTGVFVTFSDKYAHARGGNSSINSTSGGLYTTWFDDNGLYLDGTLKFSHFSNTLQTRMTDGTSVNGDYSQNGYGGALEAGYLLQPAESVWVQPYLLGSLFRAESQKTTLDNGMQADIGNTDSRQLEAGVSVGTEFSAGKTQLKPYLKAAVNHEFSSSNQVKLNDQYRFTDDISGTTGKYAVGLNASLAPGSEIWVEAGYQKGAGTESPVTATAGFRFSFCPPERYLTSLFPVRTGEQAEEMSMDVDPEVTVELKRPGEDIQHLYSLLREVALTYPLRSRHFQLDTRENGGFIYIIAQGRFEIRRCQDDLRMGIGTGPAVIGLQELFAPAPWHYIRLLDASGVFAVPLEQARSVIDAADAWKNVASVLAYYLRRAIYRDEKMVNQKSYQIICYRLQEYMKFKELHHASNTGIIRYVTHSTSLSRSQVYGVIKDLCRGGYIEIENGKLTKINHLPDGY